MAKKILYSLIILLYVITSILWIAIPEEGILNVSTLVFTVIFSIIMLIVDRKRWKKYYLSSQFKNFANSFFSAILIFLILGLVNYLVFKHPFSIDLSRNKLNTLTDQTIQVLKQVQGKIDVMVFARKTEGEAILKLLEMYRLEKSDFNIEFVDIDLRPDLVKKYEIAYSNTVLFNHRGRTQKIIARNELAVTNGVIKVTREKDPIIYYSVGHQEGDLYQKDKDGFSTLHELLTKALYDIVPVNLAQFSEIPQDIKFLMIWGPKSAFFKKEIDLIERFLNRGGRLVVALDPDSSKDIFAPLREMLRKQGVNISNDLVVDTINHFQGSNGSIPILKTFDEKHPITANFHGPIFLPLTSSVTQSKEGKFTVLAKTTIFPASWAETSIKEIKSGKLSFTPQEDLKGPVSVIAVYEGKGKILAFGNSNFVVNGYGNFGQNFMFLLNGINWSVDEGRLIAFDNTLIENEPIFIGAPQLGVIFYFSVVFAPLLLFGMAIYFYRRRLAL
jgi:ABC-type uncharacterized transport system involved in gliding motility auxiliary subunit